MADTDKDSKTEKASSKRLNEAFQKGNFAQAQEIGVVFTLFAGLLVVLWYGQDLAMNVMNLSVSIFGNLATIDINEDGIEYWSMQTMTALSRFSGPFLTLGWLERLLQEASSLGFG